MPVFDDGSDPRRSSGRDDDHGRLRKLRQLCGQVARELSHALSWELSDPFLLSVVVVRVEPAPDASRLRIFVSAMDPAVAERRDEVLARLQAAAGHLRAAVAAGIHRARTPTLCFAWTDAGEVAP